jgi:luciferase family oxidoreductase group 1
MTIPLSLLDGASISTDTTVAGALARSVELARAAERLGYARFWVVEHHSLPSVASSAPAVLIAHLATATSRIRLGSGGVMLPNHAPLVVAEQFGMLESLHPGRIDLGIGRGPGSDGLTQHALRRGPNEAVDDFPRQLAELLAFFEGAWPAEHPYRSITAIPGEGARPEVWLLGSSDFGARLAGHLGISFAFAHHFSPANAVPAIEAYRASFRPSATLAEPHVMLATNVVCAETDERARWLAAPSALAVLRMTSGRPAPLPTPEEAAAHRYTPAEQAFVDGWTATHLVGDPEVVRVGLEALADRTGADELMLAGAPVVGGIRSLELVAEAWGVAPSVA